MYRVLNYAAACAAVITSTAQATAALQLRISDGTPGATVVIQDQSIDDTNPEVGVVSYTGVLGSQWLITLSTGSSKPHIGSAAIPDIDLNSFNLSSASGGTLTVELTDTDFTGSGPATIAIGGTTQGTVALKTFVDYGNAPFGKAAPIANQGPFSGGAFANNGIGLVSSPGAYSITFELTIAHTGSGTTGLDAEMRVTPPSLTCPTNATVHCGSSLNPDVNTSLGKPVYTPSSQNCLPVTMTYSDAVTSAGPCSQTIVRIWTIVDACDLTNYCTQEITVYEDVPPVLTVPANVTVECSAPPVGSATAMDACDPNVSVQYLGESRIDGTNPACSFTLVRTWKATDSCGNAVTNNQNIVVRDTTTPVLTVPGNVTIECGSSLPAANPTATDNCSTATITFLGMTTNGSGCNYTITRKWKASDVCGNSVTNKQVITVKDTTPPVITSVPPGGEIGCTTLPSVATVKSQVVATDNCGTPTINVTSVDSGTDCSSNRTFTITATDGCNTSAVQTLTYTMNCAPCVPRTFTFEGSTTLYGTAGNVRTFTVNGVSVKASAFSRVRSGGAWATAYLGSYSGGLGVTDTSEGTGGNNSHTVDNIDRDNYVLFEFSQPVVLSRATLGYVVTDSDLSLWIGTFVDPYNNHLNLSDALLSSFSVTEENLTTLTGPRTADLNAGGVVGNAIVIAALVTDTSPEDQFKIQALDVCVRTCAPVCKASISGSIFGNCDPCLKDDREHDPRDHDGRDHSTCNHKYNQCSLDGQDHRSCRHERGWCSRDGRNHSWCSHSRGRCRVDTRSHSQCSHSLNICVHDGHKHAECKHSAGMCSHDGRDHSSCNHKYSQCSRDGQDHSGCRHERGWCKRDGRSHYGCNHAGDYCKSDTRDHSSCKHDVDICVHDGHNHDDCDHAHNRCTQGHPTSICDLAGFTVKLKNSSGVVIATQTSAGDGSYLFTDLDPGTYTVVVTPLTGYVEFSDPDGVLDNKTTITVTNCESKKEIDFGYKNGATGGISGTVLRDCDADGSLSGETGLTGWTVTLKSGSTTIDTTTTDASGNYSFTDLLGGSYVVVVTPAANYSQTYDPDGTKDNRTSVTILDNQKKTAVKFGYTGTSAGVFMVMKGPSTAKCGDTITYTFAVTNTGNTCLYGGMRVSDPLLGGEIFHQTPVSPGQGFVFTKTYVVKSSDAGTLLNKATVIGDPPGSLVNVSKSVSVSTTVTCNTPCPAPQHLSTSPGSGKVTLSWWNCSEAASYCVKRSVSKDGPFFSIKTGLTGTNCTDTAVTNGVCYYYKICGVKNGTEGYDCDPVSAIPSYLDSPWSSRDLGTPSEDGGSSLASSTFTIMGSGDDIWNSKDSFQFAYQSGYANCTVVARVTGVDNTNPWAKAGVMIRESLTAGARHAFMCITPDNGAAFQSRTATGGSSDNVNTTGIAAPYWVKIVRSGSVFTGYVSSNGTSWTKIGEQTISMTSSVYIGLAVTSHSDGVLCTATFQNVTVTP